MALKGFKSISVLGCSSASTMTITSKYFKFNGDTARELEMPKYIQFLVNDKTKQVAILACNADDENAVEFHCKDNPNERQFAISVAHKDGHPAIRRLMGWSDEKSRRMTGVYVPEEQAIIYSLDKAVELGKNE